VDGVLAGGNLALLAALAGTAYAPDLRGTILVLEDVGEAVYRVDRMLQQLRMAGMLDGVRALVFGHCTDCPEEGEDGARTLDVVLTELADALRVPCLAGVPVGHLDDQWTLPLGAPATLDVAARRLDVRMPAVTTPGAGSTVARIPSPIHPDRQTPEDPMQPKSGADLINEAKTRIREVTPKDVQGMLGEKRDVVLLDVREPNEWNLGHLPGAMHIPRGTLEGKVEQQLPRDREIVVYCAGGSRSALAADTLRQMGYENVASMSGGWREWVGSGGPVEG
jgi:rhodanese-related sulfurtransferase